MLAVFQFASCFYPLKWTFKDGAIVSWVGFSNHNYFWVSFLTIMMICFVIGKTFKCFLFQHLKLLEWTWIKMPMGSCGIISKQPFSNIKQKKQTWNNEISLPNFIHINEVTSPTACATLMPGPLQLRQGSLLLMPWNCFVDTLSKRMLYII